jgi:hypothetical protein
LIGFLKSVIFVPLPWGEYVACGLPTLLSHIVTGPIKPFSSEMCTRI